jgi:hypothetical protein
LQAFNVHIMKRPDPYPHAGPPEALEQLPQTKLVQLLQHVARERKAAETKATAAEAELSALKSIPRYLVDPPL